MDYDPAKKIMEMMEDERDGTAALSCSAPAPCSVSSLSDQINNAMPSEAWFRAVCIKEGLESLDQIEACRSVILRICNRLQKKQNKEITRRGEA